MNGLHEPYRKYRLDAVKLLLDAGVDPNQYSFDPEVGSHATTLSKSLSIKTERPNSMAFRDAASFCMTSYCTAE